MSPDPPPPLQMMKGMKGVGKLAAKLGKKIQTAAAAASVAASGSQAASSSERGGGQAAASATPPPHHRKARVRKLLATHDGCVVVAYR